MKSVKGLVIVFLLAFAALWLYDRFILKDPADDSDTGFVVQKPGIGWDDAARAGSVALVVVFGGKLVRSVLGGKKGS